MLVIDVNHPEVHISFGWHGGGCCLPWGKKAIPWDWERWRDKDNKKGKKERLATKGEKGGQTMDESGRQTHRKENLKLPHLGQPPPLDDSPRHLVGSSVSYQNPASVEDHSLQTPPPDAEHPPTTREWGVPVTPNEGPSLVSVLQPPLCSKDMGTSLICCNYHSITCICNLLIGYPPRTFSCCAYGLLDSSERLETLRAPTYFTCDESHYCWTKCRPSPFLKNRPAKTGGRETVWQSTSSRHLPHPFPPSK
ncbi:Hypothetical predicted protein [Scomber scombrus]|uniref:Uncharacterized protein n=1 Tax=Scomber scombrus TaxID=13677 RepID=A0AAV1NY86_SCOSC